MSSDLHLSASCWSHCGSFCSLLWGSVDTDCSIMVSLKQLLELVLTWIKHRQRCEEELRKLTWELESLRDIQCMWLCEHHSGSEGGCVSDWSHFVHKWSSSLFLPAAISVAAKITEPFMSCVAMKEVQDLEKKRNQTAEEIHELFEQLRKRVLLNERASDMTPNQSVLTPQLILSPAAKLLFVEITQQFIREMTKIRLKTAIQKSARVRFCSFTHTD